MAVVCSPVEYKYIGLHVIYYSNSLLSTLSVGPKRWSIHLSGISGLPASRDIARYRLRLPQAQHRYDTQQKQTYGYP